MMAMKMINQAHVRKGKIKSFNSYCGGIPSPAAANNPLAYKFRYSMSNNHNQSHFIFVNRLFVKIINQFVKSDFFIFCYIISITSSKSAFN